MNNCIDINMLFILFVKLSNMNKNLHFYLGLFFFSSGNRLPITPLFETERYLNVNSKSGNCHIAGM